MPNSFIRGWLGSTCDSHTTLQSQQPCEYCQYSFYNLIGCTRLQQGERYGAHTDYECFTILKPDSKDWSPGYGGLEVLYDGNFHPVSVPPQAFVINGGDLLQRWTNDKWVSAVHRVRKPTSAEALGTSRQSIAFFTSPRSDAFIECIPNLNGSPRYPGILAGDHVTMKINRTHV